MLRKIQHGLPSGKTARQRVHGRMLTASSTERPGTHRIAIVGAGLMGGWHAHAAERSAAKVVAVVDTDLAKARELGRRFGAPGFDRLDTATNSTRPDIVHICTPARTHLEMIETAAAAGLHIFCEKPLTPTTAETERSLSAAEKAGVRICPSHQYAFQKPVETALADMHRFGGLIDIGLSFYSAGGVQMAAEERPALAADILPHPVSILQRFFPGHDLAGSEWTLLSGAPESWQYTAYCEGVQLRILISLAARPTEATLKVAGRAAGFQADLFHGFGYFIDGKATRRTKITQPFRRSGSEFLSAGVNLAARAIRREPAYPGLQALISRFYTACAGNQPMPISHEDIRQVASIRDRFLTRVDKKCS